MNDFRELEDGELVGDDHSIVYTSIDFQISVCPDCDGYGHESEDSDLIAIIDRLTNYRGFTIAYGVDFDKRKVTRIIRFQWRQRSWKLLELPIRKFSSIFGE
jgi:hypothetical protein